ncbi:unnamed protein product [Prorocentrum cordatum]|uniref:Uncharacterized protein n=1 Tax=Prorocentrum cordatum TaxID=2364126 RepID=A0ABN9WT35_9DINO|nr:unnamed protein product [Polarella glacialis]
MAGEEAAEEAAEAAEEADAARSQPSASPTRDGLRPLRPLGAQPVSAASLLLGGKAAGQRPASIAAPLSAGPLEEESSGGGSGWKLTGATVGEQAASPSEPKRRQHIFISSQPAGCHFAS